MILQKLGHVVHFTLQVSAPVDPVINGRKSTAKSSWCPNGSWAKARDTVETHVDHHPAVVLLVVLFYLFERNELLPTGLLDALEMIRLAGPDLRVVQQDRRLDKGVGSQPCGLVRRQKTLIHSGIKHKAHRYRCYRDELTAAQG